MDYALYGAVPAFQQSSVGFGLVSYCITQLVEGFNSLANAKVPNNSGQFSFTFPTYIHILIAKILFTPTKRY